MELLFCTPETNVMLYVNYISMKIKLKVLIKRRKFSSGSSSYDCVPNAAGTGFNAWLGTQIPQAVWFNNKNK